MYVRIRPTSVSTVIRETLPLLWNLGNINKLPEYTNDLENVIKSNVFQYTSDEYAKFQLLTSV